MVRNAKEKWTTADWAFYVQSTLQSLPKLDKPEQTAFKRNRSIVPPIFQIWKKQVTHQGHTYITMSMALI